MTVREYAGGRLGGQYWIIEAVGCGFRGLRQER